MADRVIIADDLTGALDAAAPFAMRGISTAVALTVDALPQALETGARIVGVSTDSREISPAAARDAVARALALLPPGTALFKKVDSRLKGNIAAELDAFAPAKSLAIPAIPAFGRLAKNGKIVGFGVSDPIDIADRLGTHAATATIPDIASQADIETALAADFDLPIGARGLAEAMALTMAPDARPADIALPATPVFCVIGSTDPITATQIEHLRQSAPDLRYVEAPNGVAVPSPRRGALTLLRATEGTAPQSATAVAEALAGSLQALDIPDDALLVLSGGATAQAILRALGVEVLDLLGEALPGLPIARAGRLTVITKSGGFGTPDTLSRLLAPSLSPGAQ